MKHNIIYIGYGYTFIYSHDDSSSDAYSVLGYDTFVHFSYIISFLISYEGIKNVKVKSDIFNIA